uniref:Uncharacterized protein n=1 Tax=Rhizophora mucronata TaxID=61149 RepID=A0A2P2QS20_RHIMU
MKRYANSFFDKITFLISEIFDFNLISSI